MGKKRAKDVAWSCFSGHIRFPVQIEAGILSPTGLVVIFDPVMEEGKTS